MRSFSTSPTGILLALVLAIVTHPRVLDGAPVDRTAPVVVAASTTHDVVVASAATPWTSSCARPRTASPDDAASSTPSHGVSTDVSTTSTACEPGGRTRFVRDGRSTHLRLSVLRI